MPFWGRLPYLPLPVQTKLAISEPGDEYQQEADRVAEAVMRDDPAPHLPAKEKSRRTSNAWKGNNPLLEEKKQENTEERVEKVAETFLDGTELGIELKEQIKTGGEDFLATLHGLVFTGVRRRGSFPFLPPTIWSCPCRCRRLP